MSILRDLFGPSRNEIWQQFAAAVGGNMTEGGFWTGGSKVEAVHGQWIITLDTYTVSTGKSSITYTRMRAPYVNPEGFQFTIYRRGIFSDIGKWLGMQDVEVGEPKFDEDRFWGGRNFPPGVDELYFRVTGVIKDVDRLKLLYDLFSETLDELCRMGVAYEKPPGVTL